MGLGLVFSKIKAGESPLHKHFLRVWLAFVICLGKAQFRANHNYKVKQIPNFQSTINPRWVFKKLMVDILNSYDILNANDTFKELIFTQK